MIHKERSIASKAVSGFVKRSSANDGIDSDLERRGSGQRVLANRWNWYVFCGSAPTRSGTLHHPIYPPSSDPISPSPPVETGRHTGVLLMTLMLPGKPLKQRLEETQQAEESARLTAQRERVKYKAPMENGEAAQRVAESESQAIEESKDNQTTLSLSSSLRYRRYSIEEIKKATEYFNKALKVGEGGYEPVFKCYLDHTPVAVKVFRPDAAQGRSQFNKEVEVLSCMRHPNMVLLLGACPEYGCLVYEYMSNDSLEDLAPML